MALMNPAGFARRTFTTSSCAMCVRGSRVAHSGSRAPGSMGDCAHRRRAPWSWRGHDCRCTGRGGHRLRGPVVGQPLERDRIPGAVPREAGREAPIILGDPHGRMHVEPRMRPSEHPGGLVFIRTARGARRAGARRGDAGDLAEQSATIPAIRAKPCSRTPHARNFSAPSARTGRHGPYSRAKRSSYTVCRRCR